MSLRKLGSFIKIKNNGIQPLGITKNRMLKVWISIWNEFAFASIVYEAKEFEKSSSDGYGGCFSFAASVLLFRLAYNQLAQFKKAKEMLEMGLDYLVDDNALTINFNIQLGEACHGLGDEKKKISIFLKPINY
jgi:hypothetical protein